MYLTLLVRACQIRIGNGVYLLTYSGYRQSTTMPDHYAAFVIGCNTPYDVVGQGLRVLSVMLISGHSLALQGIQPVAATYQHLIASCRQTLDAHRSGERHGGPTIGVRLVTIERLVES